LRAALTAEVRAALAELDTDTPDPKSVHRARVRLKRARGLARVGRISAPGLAEVFNDSARACMHALAPARDAAALAEAAREAARKENKKTGKALSRTADWLDLAQRNMAALDMDGVRTGLKDLLALAQVWPEASPRQIARGARRVAKRAKRARRAAIGASAPELRHTWRKREKERLYVSEILGDAWPRRRKRRSTEKLAAALGRERDARLLSERLVQTASDEDAGAKRALRALKRRRQRLARRADRFGGKLKDA
jgi:hypothetical protein